MFQNNEIKIFVINLKKDRHKRSAIVKHLSSLQLAYEIIDAVDGRLLSDVQVENMTDVRLSKKLIGRGLTRGEVGCALSHLEIYKRVLNENLNYALILEDDVTVSDKIFDFFDCLSNLPEKLDVLLLGYYNNPNTEKKSTASFWGSMSIGKSYRCLRLIEKAYGTHGYIITNAGANKIIKDTENLIEPIDHYTGNYQKYSVYGINNLLVKLDPYYSKQSNISAERSINSENVAKVRKFKGLKLFIRRFFPVKRYY
ncbi:glycosyltransferase family 25 protein [Vibrio breoganii]